MQVLTLTPFYPTARDDAAGCFIAEPLRMMEERGVQSHVVAVQAFYRAGIHPSPSAPPASWIRYPSLPSGIGLASAGAFLYANLISRVRKLHRSQPIDLIHAHAALPCGHAAALLGRELRIPFVVTVHGLDAFFINQVSGYAGECCKRVAQFVYRSASQVVCISDKVCDQVLQGAAGPVRTALIYNGVDPQMFSPIHYEPESPTILSVGNLIPIKAHELLLQAIAAIRERYPNLSCEVIGDGPERPRLAKLARNSTSPAGFAFSDGGVEKRLPRPCAAARFSRYPAATKVWGVSTSRRCPRGKARDCLQRTRYWRDHPTRNQRLAYRSR